jgi:hypothetical protein
MIDLRAPDFFQLGEKRSTPTSNRTYTMCPESGHNYIPERIHLKEDTHGRSRAFPLKKMRSSLITSIPIAAALLAAQPPPPQLDSRAVERRIGEIRNRLERNAPVTPEQKELASFAQRYLDDASRAVAAGRRFQAQRLADAADACRRPLDHLQRVAGPGPKPPGDPEDHLRNVYFRLRLCDFFLQQIPSPKPVRLLELARRFYDQAVKLRQEGNAAIADEYTAAADDLTHALESLAQAELPERP